jgi:virginiamycin B lyase
MTIPPDDSSFPQEFNAPYQVTGDVTGNGIVLRFDDQRKHGGILQRRDANVRAGFRSAAAGAAFGGCRGRRLGSRFFGQHFPNDASTGTWNSVPGNLSFIQVAPNREVAPSRSAWGINSAGQTYTYDASTQSWTNIPGTLAQLSVGVDGTVWGLNAQQQIYQFDPATQSWTNIPGSLIQISVGNANSIWGVNAFQQVYRYDAATKSWMQIPGAYLVNISTGFDGSVWGVNAAGGLYRWDSDSRVFNLAGGRFSNVVIGNAASVWA